MEYVHTLCDRRQCADFVKKFPDVEKLHMDFSRGFLSFSKYPLMFPPNLRELSIYELCSEVDAKSLPKTLEVLKISKIPDCLKLLDLSSFSKLLEFEYSRDSCRTNRLILTLPPSITKLDCYCDIRDLPLLEEARNAHLYGSFPKLLRIYDGILDGDADVPEIYRTCDYFTVCGNMLLLYDIECCIHEYFGNLGKKVEILCIGIHPRVVVLSEYTKFFPNLKEVHIGFEVDDVVSDSSIILEHLTCSSEVSGDTSGISKITIGKHDPDMMRSGLPNYRGRFFK